MAADVADAQHSTLVELSEDVRATALQRFTLLRPFLEDGVPLSRIAQAHGLKRRTLWHWVAQYRHKGIMGLVRQPRADRGVRRRVSPELQQLIEALALRTPPPTAAFVHRQVVEIAEQRGWSKPSYDRVYDVIGRLDPALITLAHDGPKVYREEFDLLHRREAGSPNKIWQADHTPLDIWLLDDYSQPARPWLTAIIDDYSRAIPGYYLSFQAPCILHTSLALRQAIWRKEDPRWHICGIPETFYTDHGGDFTSHHLEQVSADLKIELIFSWPGVPRGRGRIERFFETLNQLFLCRLPGYTPAGSPRGTATLTLAEFEAQLQEFILDEYHLREHGGTGLAPQVRWEAGGFLPQMPESLEQLDLLLLTVAKARRVHQDGIHFQGMRYLDLVLAAYVGEWVTIRYDPRDLAEIRVFHQQRFLCRAICQELADQTLSLKEIIRARNARRRALRAHIAARANVADQLLAEQKPKPRPSDAADVPPPLKRYLND